MSPETARTAVERRLEQLGEDAAEPIPLAAVAEIVEDIVASMQGDDSAPGLQLMQEIAALAQIIQTTKAEITALNPEEIREQHIPSATDELDAVVSAAEQATHEIMAEAETVEAVAEQLDEALAQRLNDAVTNIYEACGFQDVTGQRISKVVRALHDIEGKVDAMLATLGDTPAQERQAQRAAAADSAPCADRELLNGPPKDGEARSQDDIDALFASF
jgi:chemotaxis protein CheZ